MKNVSDLGFLAQTGLARIHGDKPWISVGMGTCGIGSGADKVWEILNQTAKTSEFWYAGSDVSVFALQSLLS